MSNKQLIQQYVNSGSLLPKYQVDKLSGSLLKSYLKVRLRQANAEEEYVLHPYEVVHLDDETITDYISKLNHRRLREFIKRSSKSGMGRKMAPLITKALGSKLFLDYFITSDILYLMGEDMDDYIKDIVGKYYSPKEEYDEVMQLLLGGVDNVTELVNIIESKHEGAFKAMMLRLINDMDSLQNVSGVVRDEKGLFTLLVKNGLVGAILLNSETPIVDAKLIGMDNVKRFYDENIANLSDETKSTMTAISPNSEELGQLFKELSNEQ
jgi:hypothetical protein